MNILLSNDDGVHAKGLQVLAQSLSDVGHVTVVAPDRDRSGVSKSLTLDRPIAAQKLANGFYSVDGTPTDCVHLGIHAVLDVIPDIVIAGINAGANLGDDVLYSGTVAAAVEGRHFGKPSIAVSLLGPCIHYESAAHIVKKMLMQSHALDIPPQTILNVNVPDLPLAELRGIKLTRLGHREPSGAPIKIQDPRGKDRYWVAPVGAIKDAADDTDFYAVHHGFVSVTPLHVNMTCVDVFEKVGVWLRDIT